MTPDDVAIKAIERKKATLRKRIAVLEAQVAECDAAIARLKA